jgi:hypothetical protein
MPLIGRSGRLVLGLLLASSALAACTGVAAPTTGSTGTPGPVAGSVEATNAVGQGGGAVTLPDACSLLTPDEIKAQCTFDVGPGKGSSSDSGATSPDCSWQPIDFQPSFGGVQVMVQAFDQGYFDFTKGSTSKDVAGVGDAAYFSQPTNPATLQWKAGNLHFTLYVVAGGLADTPETLQQKVIALAQNVLAHL